MQRLIPLLCFGVATLGLTSCGLSPSGGDTPDASTSANQQLERRINQLEQELQELKPAGDADSKTPAGPLRSLTLRIGTEDDRRGCTGLMARPAT